MAAATLFVSPAAFPLAALPLPRADSGRSVRVMPHRAKQVAVPLLERCAVHLLPWNRQQHRPGTLAEAATARSALAAGDMWQAGLSSTDGRPAMMSWRPAAISTEPLGGS